MPWHRNDPDPLEGMRRKLAEQERLIAEKMAQLNDGRDPSETPSVPVKPAEPPIWREEDDVVSKQMVEPLPARKRHLARQRQRDMLLFFIAVGVLIIVIVILLWVAYVHNMASNTGG